jgi:hypothetical protein
MRFVVKLLISIAVIVFCTQIGRKVPTLAGLIAVMPLTGLVVLVWLYLDNPDNFGLMSDYCTGALWGIVCFSSWLLCAFANSYPSGLCFARASPSGSSPRLFISGCFINGEPSRSRSIPLEIWNKPKRVFSTMPVGCGNPGGCGMCEQRRKLCKQTKTPT